ncbi:rhodanese-like domain-containing protein [Aquibacillus sp. 3ASR75-11]|uniref:Rhodanese-like domain-containing protein n=1 Tax=Terrihalobacillus insolitus TaxID=2950438 RepID=A0A9X3WUN9_9BACI|nr:rhodanese-like domain-containing protein [Terrihalobacillus insolitus]MDC3424336.1 rhodanese-like domain-containing protein [Terrihalobacillus insolitus]
MGTKLKIEEVKPFDIARRLKNDENLNIIDVREDNEVETGKIPGAKHIPLGEILTRTDELDKDKEYIMVCRSGNRSGLASDWLTDKGFKVKNMAGGMSEWDSDLE